MGHEVRQFSHNVPGYEGTTHLAPNYSLSAQYPLPPFMYPLVEQYPNDGTQSFNQGLQGSIAGPSANTELGKGLGTASSLPVLNGFTAQPRRTRQSRRGSIRSSEKARSRSMTTQKLKDRRRLSPQKELPLDSDLTHGKKPESVVVKPKPKTFPIGCTTDEGASRIYTLKFQEGIALVQESIKPFSPFSRRKAADLINKVTELVKQLDQLVHEEQKYGNAASDVEDITRPTIASSSKDSISNSDLGESESETDNTSISSITREIEVESQDSVSAENVQHGPVHPPCMHCGIKRLYYCTRKDCRYSSHSLPEWKRHENSQKHSQQERFMCLECPISPPPVDMNGNSICEFCHSSNPNFGANLAAHYLQCQAAQQASTTYGRKDRLIAHLRSHPGILNASHIAALGRYTVDCKWPRQCGFCGAFFNTWDERIDHIAGHFQAGLDMSSWRLPFLRPKDSRPGFKPHQKGDDNDSDDDMDDNDSRPSSQRTGSQQQSSSTGSSQKSHSNENQKRRSSSQGGHKRRHRVSQTDYDDYAAPGRNNIPGYAKTSVALERYLNDNEEPIEIRLSLGSKTAKAGLTRNQFSIDVDANLQVADQQTKHRSKPSQGSQPLKIETASQAPLQVFQPISSLHLARTHSIIPTNLEISLKEGEHYERPRIEETLPLRQAETIRKGTYTAGTAMSKMKDGHLAITVDYGTTHTGMIH